MALDWHPAHILLQLKEIPDVPDAVDCAYDEEAVALYSNVMKAVRRFFSKDILKYEDFKINSRLVGNNFMEAHEYVDYLAKAFGGLRMLLLIPCLIMIQPDPIKRTLLLTAARLYRTRNLASLKQRCHAESQSEKQNLSAVENNLRSQHSFALENEQSNATPTDITLVLSQSDARNVSNKSVACDVESHKKVQMEDQLMSKHVKMNTVPTSIIERQANPPPPRNLFQLASDSNSDSDSDFGSP